MIKRVATAVVLIPLVLLLVLKAPLYVLAIVAGAVALLAIVEFLKLLTHYAVQPLRPATYAFVALFFVFVIVVSTNRTPLVETTAMLYGIALAAALAPFVFLTVAMRRPNLPPAIRRRPLRCLPSRTSRSRWRCWSRYASSRRERSGRSTRCSPCGRETSSLTSWASRWGGIACRREISPKKTWEGAVASILASVIVGMLWIQHAPGISPALLRIGLIDRRDGMFGLEQPPLWPIILLSAVVNIAAQLGDLVESLIKRGAGVKDSGTILPGHGGMLDRIDAMLFAVPVVWAYGAWRLLQ